MRCPRCASEVQQNPCSHCSLVTPVLNQFEPFNHAPASAPKRTTLSSSVFSLRDERSKLSHRPRGFQPGSTIDRHFDASAASL